MAGQNQLISKFITLAYHSSVDKTSDPKNKLLDKFHQQMQEKIAFRLDLAGLYQHHGWTKKLRSLHFKMTFAVATSAAKKI